MEVFFSLGYCIALNASFCKVTAKTKSTASTLGHNKADFEGSLSLTSKYVNTDIHEAYFLFLFYLQLNFFQERLYMLTLFHFFLFHFSR